MPLYDCSDVELMLVGFCFRQKKTGNMNDNSYSNASSSGILNSP